MTSGRLCTSTKGRRQMGYLYPDNAISRGLGTSDTVTLRSLDYPVGGGLGRRRAERDSVCRY